ncbi:excinuclease ABC subunit UvrA [Planomonospora sp. ID91781]|uniref:ATP-binding cassette domain-containing protein n=1 Tax=Planomonospora sp. ID91781 TaxID=2738135 RepID=UPI0018C405FE|nr:excinuclease ABC subunit UvrA [Planomonospora sp. ID91781]MBG0823438.1 excinuclease ABC subunit UvrA [Planomonospora sp. ID91781]
MAEQDGIRITGARVHNLKDVSLTIPKNKITVFTGVSGSGKSSLVFDTVGVEAQRQLNAAFPWFIRNQLPKYERPQADAVENLTTPVIVDQKPVGGDARSTVGTMTDIYSMVRALFARQEGPGGRVSTYSFNDPAGMCPECEGLGRAVQVDLELFFDRTRSLEDGAIRYPEYKVGSPDWQIWVNSGRFDPAKPLQDFTDEEWHDLLHGTGGPKIQVKTKNVSFQTNYEGVIDRFTRLNLKRDLSALSAKRRETVERFMTTGVCHACGGARLNATALATRVGGRNIAEWCAMQITDLREALNGTDDPLAAPIAAALDRVIAIGLGYLSLDRPTPTLSGGEGQRLKMVRHLGSELTGLTYIFDEPSVGLHPRDVERLTEQLRALRDRGNTVLVVEHDPDVIAVADHVVDVGPGAGSHGGEIVFSGDLDGLRGSGTATGRALGAPAEVKEDVRRPRGELRIEHAGLHNLKDVSVAVPTGVLTAVTGVAGAGKSTLIGEVFRARHPEAVFVDQSPIAASSRSTPATYLGMMDPIRKLFAKAGGVDAGLFSFNSKGACEECQGRGAIITELAFADPVTVHCQACGGRRFKEEVLAHRLRGASIADVLELPAEAAAGFFTEKALRAKAQALIDVGLGYLTLGQPLSSLSGGELQRIKLADRLGRSGEVYVLDEPTTGLHLSDVDTLMALLDRMVDEGNTVVVVEHHLDVVRRADWVIDLGPGGGHDGGRVVFTGTPRELAGSEDSITAEYLRRHLRSRAAAPAG